MEKKPKPETGYKTLKDFGSLKGKKILLRVDINSSIINGKPEAGERMSAHAQTIKWLCGEGASVVVLAHQGRPGEGLLSLEKHAKLLNEMVKIGFVNDTIGDKAIGALRRLKPGEALMLENVRMLKEEFRPFEHNALISTLGPFFDLFVLDALSVAHRNEASVTGFAERLPHCMGPVMAREVDNIENVSVRTKKPFTVIFGGLKLDDYFGVFESMMKKGDVTKVLTSGAMGQLFIMARGSRLGVTEKFMEKKGLLKLLPEVKKIDRKYRKKIEVPIDVAVEAGGKRVDVEVKALPSNYDIYDIGPKTAELYAGIIKKSKTIFLKGVPGAYEKPGFGEGTRKVMAAIASSDGFSLIGGGESSTALDYFRINKKRIGYVSLSGGALLKLMAGDRLPGIEVMRK